MEHDSKLCLKCARRKLAGKKAKPCGTCILLNVDPMAQVRANASREIAGIRFMNSAVSVSSLLGGITQKPARATSAGRRA